MNRDSRKCYEYQSALFPYDERNALFLVLEKEKGEEASKYGYQCR